MSQNKTDVLWLGFLHGHIAKACELLVIAQCDHEGCLVSRLIEAGKSLSSRSRFKLGGRQPTATR